jgi:transposase
MDAMEQMIDCCGGLDVHRDTVVATVRAPGSQQRERRIATRTFTTTTSGLSELGDWLVAEHVELVGMESTGVYWKPVFFALEERIDQVWLLNAEHLRNVPGRKTDVADSVWIAELVEHGLVRPSFVPPADIRALRDLTRYRRTLVEERTRAIQRLEKVMQDAGIKLTSVASTLLGKSGRAIIDALLAGVSDPVMLAELAKGRLRSKIPALREALTGAFRVEHHGLLVRQMLAHIDFLDESVAVIDAKIESAITVHEPVIERLVTIPGVARKTAIGLIAEVGVDMSVFPTPADLASWAGICPGNNASGGKRRSGRTRHGSVWLRTVLTEAAQAAARTKGTYLAAHHATVRGRRGRFKAIGATRHDLLIAYWHVVHDEVDYRELGADWAVRRFSPEHQLKRLIRQIERLGKTVTVTDAA